MTATKLKIAACALFALVPAGFEASDEDEPGYSRKGADTCLACHEDRTTLEIFATPHAVPSDSRGPFGHGQLQCEACHGPGDAHSGRVRRGQDRPAVIRFADDDGTPIATRNAMCTTCHDADLGIGWHAGPHAGDEVACSDCHQSHARIDAVSRQETQAGVCADCHSLPRNQTRRAFAHPLFEGKMSCTSCHGMHDDAVATGLARATVNATCFECHADKRGPFLWEHAPVSEDCGLCHAAHGSNHPGMLTQRAPLLCQACHSQSGHPAVAYGSDALTSTGQSQYLLAQGCMNCHSQVHGSNHPSGSRLTR